MTSAIRPWCAKIQYPGQKPCIASAGYLPADPQTHEILDGIRAHLLTYLPDGLEILKPMCGALFFIPGGDHE